MTSTHSVTTCSAVLMRTRSPGRPEASNAMATIGAPTSVGALQSKLQSGGTALPASVPAT